MSQPVSGILLLDKPGMESRTSAMEPGDAAWPTSHDMVRHVRRCLGVKRVGHTGTLDPFASGLLVVCIGKATRLAEYYQELPKTYLAQIRLGTETATDDVTGDVVDQVHPVVVDPDLLEEKLQEFRGPQDQMPPAYSAKRIQGQRAYELARAGEHVELTPARITIHDLDITEPLHDDHVTVRVTCSAGTYIRSLARDLGRALAVGGCLARLRRVALGDLRVEEALAPDALAQRGWEAVLAPGTGLPGPRIVCDAAARRRLGYGQWVEYPLPAQDPGALALAVDEEGVFWGILTCAAVPGQDVIKLKARKWLAPV